MEDEGKDYGFDASHERCNAKVDVVVCRSGSWAKELAIQEVEEQLQERLVTLCHSHVAVR